MMPMRAPGSREGGFGLRRESTSTPTTAVALAGGAQGWLLRRTLLVERLMLIAAGLALVYPKPVFDAIGIGLVLAVLAMQKLVKRSQELETGTPK